ncbi:hypothetical protein GN244_ATG19845 [Phytophthora infestans]|uniref:Uncharacterized protein n=1 Tax=Phytophthora infestans TaxID=4787 RepID=A0A833W4P7_PHYIN|nr:hypothetical protein GN244_ATG19845 [Phytophthora infestans]
MASKAGDVATADCRPYLLSFNGTDCVAPADAHCVLIQSDVWGCSFLKKEYTSGVDSETTAAYGGERPDTTTDNGEGDQEVSTQYPTEAILTETPTDEVSTPCPTDEVTTQPPTEAVTAQPPTEDAMTQPPPTEDATTQPPTEDAMTQPPPTEDATTQPPTENVTTQPP